MIFLHNVYVHTAALLTPRGKTWRGMSADQTPMPSSLIPDELLKPVRPDDLRKKKMMSRSAWIAYLTLHDLMSQMRVPAAKDQIAYFLGVGASGSTELELVSLVERGIDACNPLIAFQLMNNFTLCHGAICEELCGPNSAFFSKGVGTATALLEAGFALSEKRCSFAIAGGADSALHPLTWAEMQRLQGNSRDLHPTEGCALLGLSLERSGALAEVTDVDLRTQKANSVDPTPWLGESLAAKPAIAWVWALDLLICENRECVAVTTRDIDGQASTIEFKRVIT